jgi:hypothetical protein
MKYEMRFPDPINASLKAILFGGPNERALAAMVRQHRLPALPIAPGMAGLLASLKIARMI